MPGRGSERDEIHDAAWRESYPHPFISCLMPLIALLAVAAVVIFGFQLWEWSLPRETKVPVVVGLQQEDAVNQLRRTGLKADIYQYQQPSETISAGAVISSNPVGGRRVKQGRIVTLVISSGSAYTQVPDVRELSLTEARDKLHQASLNIASETYTYHPTVGLDRVLEVLPAPGTKLKRNSAIAVKVSKGPEPKEQPDAGDVNMHTSTITVDLPTDTDQPDTVRIDVVDDNGRNTVYEHQHNPGDTISYTVQGAGATTVEVYFGSKLILTRQL